MAIPDPLVTPLAEELLACFCAALAEVHEEANVPAQCCLRTGNLVNFLMSTTQDECCKGLAWVRAVSVYPTDGTMQQLVAPIDVSGRVYSWGVQLEMGVARCAPGGTVQHVPTCDDWTGVTHAVNDDASAMRRAFCCFAEAHKGRVAPLLWEPLPVEGGCTGGIMQLMLRGPNCDC